MATFHDFNVVLISKLLKLMMYLSVKETNIVTIQTCTNTVLRFLHPNWMSQENPCSLVTVTQCCVTQLRLFGRDVLNTAAKGTIQKAIAKTSFSQISEVANIRHVAIPPCTRG